jgi:hypothetical protein
MTFEDSSVLRDDGGGVGSRNQKTVGTPTITTTQKSITQPIRHPPSPFPLERRCVKEKAQAMPKQDGNISVADQPVGLKENLPLKTNRGLSCKTVQTILEAHSSGSTPIANGILNLLIFNPLPDRHDQTVMACHMQGS